MSESSEIEKVSSDVEAWSEVDADETQEISTRQMRAMRMLVEGKSIAGIARELEIARGTIYRWLDSNKRFRALYEQFQEKMERDCRSRLTMLAEKAVNAIARSLNAGDARSGFALLKGLGLLRPAPERTTNPEEFTTQAERDAHRRYEDQMGDLSTETPWERDARLRLESRMKGLPGDAPAKQLPPAQLQALPGT